MSDLILANIIDHKRVECPTLDVVTFVNVEPDGSLSDVVRTYQDLWEAGQRVAAGLDDEGMQRGESFALVMQNHPEFLDAMVGASIAATVFVPIDARTRGEKLAFMLDFSECRGAVIADYALANLIEVIGSTPRLRWVWVVDTGLGIELPTAFRCRSWRSVMAVEYPGLAIRSDDAQAPMQMLYTSGTTGDPKAILSPHARFGTIASLGPAIGLRQDDRPYTGLSLTHSNAQFLTLGTALTLGLRAVISRRFTKSKLWDITRRYGCTMFNLLGGMSTAIFAEPRRADDRVNPVRYVLSAGMPVSIWNDFSERFGVDIFEFYGTAEGGLTLNPPHVGPVGSIGRPPANLRCAIFGDDGRACPTETSGEICFRNSDETPLQVAYYKNPDASLRKTAGGWLRSGDIGRFDADGWCYFENRAGGSIRRNGAFITAAYVEKVIAASPSVRDVFVYGVRTPANAPGEKEVVAAVEVDGEFDPTELFALCRAGLDANSVPTFFQRVDEIPKTASEKPQERLLIEAFAHDAANVYADPNGRETMR